MSIYTYNTAVGTFEIREDHYGRFELWIEDEKLGSYESAESAAKDVTIFNTGYNEWDAFENELTDNHPSNLNDWSKVMEDSPT